MRHCLLSFTTIKRGGTRSKELMLKDEATGQVLLRSTTDDAFATGCFLFYSAGAEGRPLGFLEASLTGLSYTLKDQSGRDLSTVNISFSLQPQPVSLRVRLAELQDANLMMPICGTNFPGSLAMCSSLAASAFDEPIRRAASSPPPRQSSHAYGTIDTCASENYNPDSGSQISNRQSLNSSHSSSIASNVREWGGETSNPYVPHLAHTSNGRGKSGSAATRTSHHPSAHRHSIGDDPHIGHEGSDFTTRCPKWNSETGCYLHNLGSRVKRANNKNFVLISSHTGERNREDDHTKVFLRFGQLSREEFVFDFRYVSASPPPGAAALGANPSLSLSLPPLNCPQRGRFFPHGGIGDCLQRTHGEDAVPAMRKLEVKTAHQHTQVCHVKTNNIQDKKTPPLQSLSSNSPLSHRTPTLEALS